MLLCEANVDPTKVVTFVGSRPDGPSDRAQLMFDFLVNPKIWLALALALARERAEPLGDALKRAVTLPQYGQWATFLRNHDELDLSRLTDSQRADVFDVFAPQADVQLFGRGIRRRMARCWARIELAYALQFSLPGAPVVRWFENLSQTLRTAPEIGTGTASVVDVPLPDSVLAHRLDAPLGALLLLHNLADVEVSLDLGPQEGAEDAPYDLLVDGPYDAPTPDLRGLALHGYGYRWIRLSRSDLI